MEGGRRGMEQEPKGPCCTQPPELREPRPTRGHYRHTSHRPHRRRGGGGDKRVRSRRRGSWHVRSTQQQRRPARGGVGQREARMPAARRRVAASAGAWARAPCRGRTRGCAAAGCCAAQQPPPPSPPRRVQAGRQAGATAGQRSAVQLLTSPSQRRPESWLRLRREEGSARGRGARGSAP